MGGWRRTFFLFCLRPTRRMEHRRDGNTMCAPKKSGSGSQLIVVYWASPLRREYLISFARSLFFPLVLSPPVNKLCIHRSHPISSATKWVSSLLLCAEYISSLWSWTPNVVPPSLRTAAAAGGGAFVCHLHNIPYLSCAADGTPDAQCALATFNKLIKRLHLMRESLFAFWRYSTENVHVVDVERWYKFRMPRTRVTHATFNFNSGMWRRRLYWVSGEASIRLSPSIFRISIKRIKRPRPDLCVCVWNYHGLRIIKTIIKARRFGPNFIMYHNVCSPKLWKIEMPSSGKHIFFSIARTGSRLHFRWIRFVYLFGSLSSFWAHSLATVTAIQNQHYARKQFRIYMKIYYRIYRSTIDLLCPAVLGIWQTNSKSPRWCVLSIECLCTVSPWCDAI